MRCPECGGVWVLVNAAPMEYRCADCGAPRENPLAGDVFLTPDGPWVKVPPGDNYTYHIEYYDEPGEKESEMGTVFDVCVVTASDGEVHDILVPTEQVVADSAEDARVAVALKYAETLRGKAGVKVLVRPFA